MNHLKYAQRIARHFSGLETAGESCEQIEDLAPIPGVDIVRGMAAFLSDDQRVKFLCDQSVLTVWISRPSRHWEILSLELPRGNIGEIDKRQSNIPIIVAKEGAFMTLPREDILEVFDTLAELSPLLDLGTEELIQSNETLVDAYARHIGTIDRKHQG